MAVFKTFGHNPSKKAKEKIILSPHYREGIFQNLSPTATLIDGASFLRIAWRFFNKPKNTKPPGVLPGIRTNLAALSADRPTIVWFGHSSYFISINGRNILIDPVLSGHASPFSFTAKSFAGSDLYTPGDFPPIDILLLTHDHYDHLDYKAVLKFIPRTQMICTSLGVGSHLRYWGVRPEIIQEFDWWEEKQLDQDIRLTAAPARHFSGRLFTRGKTFWSSFILQTGSYRIYIGGDSGYDSHFITIGEKYGPFDIAMLECGQYNEWWPLIHMMPEETAQAAVDLRARLLLPVHWGKFALSLHSWDDPIRRVVTKAAELNMPITTPRIGEPVVLGSSHPGDAWWEQVK